VYEIKLDGFRCLAFVDGEEVFLQSRGSRPLGRYFPELEFPRGRYVLDGEVFWGQDRIELLADALKSGRAPYRSQV